MAMKLLEKDVHDKQDTIISLREQLDDIKRINMDMYIKLQVGLIERLFHFSIFSHLISTFQECEADITHKGALVAKLESKTQDISRMLERLSRSGGGGGGGGVATANKP